MAVGALDFVVLGTYLLLMLVLGGWLGRGNRSAQDYLLGGRGLPWWALLLSIVATETSTATFLSVPGIACAGLPSATGDLRYLQLPLGFLAGRALAAHWLVPRFRTGALGSAYELLQRHSGRTVQRLASGLFLVTRTVADGLRLWLCAVVLQTLLACNQATAVAATALVTLAYTVFGGLRAVVWTDVVQFGIYLLGAGAALWVLHGALPEGLGTALATAASAPDFRVLDWGFDLANPYTVWAGVFGGALLSLGTHGVDHLVVQRVLSARTTRDAQRAVLWSGPVVLLQFALFLVLGLGLSQYYAAHPPAEPFARGDQVFPHFLVHHLPSGLRGLVLGALFAAAMSTLSSSLSASASALVHDFLVPWSGRADDAVWQLRAARWATLGFGGLQVTVALGDFGGGAAVVNQVLGIATVTTGVILGLFGLSLSPACGPRHAAFGALAGLVTVALVFWVLPHWFELAWPWRGCLSSGATLLGGFGSFAWQRLRPSHAPW